MPKKFAGGNSKADAAREKKASAAAQKQAKADAEKSRAEDADWAKGSKQNSKKAAEDEKKRQAQARKNEAAALLAAEEKELAKFKPKAPVKGEAKKAEKIAQKVENFTKSLKQDVEEFSASNIDDALDLLTLDTPSTASASNGGDKIDRHPERRAKAAYNAYCERELPTVRAENPGLRLTQLKEIIWKQWQKSPENPMNSELAIAYNATREDEREILKSKKDAIQDRLRVNRG